MDIKSMVNKLVRLYKTRDPFEMIRGMNVILISYPLEGVRGFYQYFQRNNIIYIDDRLPKHEQKVRPLPCKSSHFARPPEKDRG